jgi:hypothetical protein
MRVLVALAALVALSAATDTEANPIRRVVNILQKMQKECKAEGERDEELHTKFMCYCKTGASKLSKEVADQQALAAQQGAEAKQKFARSAQLDAEVAQHKKDREEAKANIEKAQSIRAKEQAEYEKAAGDAKQNIDALNKAVSAISRGMGKAFLQSPAHIAPLKRAVSASMDATETEKQTVLAFLASPYGDYQAASGEIVGILKTMKDEMDKDLGGIISDEEAAVKSHNELMAAKNDEIAAATKAIEEKQVRSGELKVQATEAKNAAANAQAEAGENSEFAGNLVENCKTKEAEYAERQKTRNQEIVAISEAIKILNDDDALEVFKKTLPSPTSLSQQILLQTDTPSRKKQVNAYAMVQSLAAVSPKPARLSLLAYMLRVGKVDFSKVIKMIDDMIAHLAQEQKDDDDHRNMCNTELDENNDNKKSQERTIRDLSASIDEAKERIAQLKESMETTMTDMEATKAASEEATKNRQKENAEFKQTMIELNAAKQLLAKAKNRLNKFYNPSQYVPPPQRELTEEERIAQNMGETIEQGPAETIAGTDQTVYIQKLDIGEAPETATYEKKTAKSGGVLQLMAMLAKDIDSQMQEEEHDEGVAQRGYEKLMSESKNSLQESQKSLTQMEGELAETETQKNGDKQKRADTNKELMATNEKIAALHQSCDFLLQNFDFRKEARARESDGLKNAKATLAGANFGF